MATFEIEEGKMEFGMGLHGANCRNILTKNEFKYKVKYHNITQYK